MHEGHSHEHHHESGAADRDKALALLTYMVDHNMHHAEELKEIAHSLEHLEMETTAGLVEDAISMFVKGNDLLAAALGLLKEDS